jgi:hypothetical protein
VRAAKHLAFHHFQPVDVPLDRAGTPRQGDAGFDRCIVLAEPARKALEGLQRTGRRARKPGIEALGLPLADQGREVLREVVYLYRAGNSVARKSGKIPPFHHRVRGTLPWYHISFSTN